MAEKKVEFAINITGDATKQLKVISDDFKDLAKSVRPVTKAIKDFKKAIGSLRNTVSLQKIVANLQEIDKLKFPNLKQLADGFKDLGKIKTPADLKPFADEIRKFQGLKLPNLKQIAQGFKLLGDESLSMVAVGKRLRILQRNLKNFTSVKLPNFQNLVSGLQSLTSASTDMPKVATRLFVIQTSLKGFSNIKVPNIAQIAIGLRQLTDASLDIAKAGVYLRVVAKSLALFKDIKVPNINSLVNGLKKLVDLKIDNVSTKIKELNLEFGKLGKSGYLSNFAKFASDLRAISGQLKTTNNSLKNYNEIVKKSAKATRTFGDRIQQYFQYRLIADFVFNLKRAVAAAWDSIKDYDQALKDLQAITGATSEQVSMMGDAIRQVASDTKFSASEVAEGMRTIGQAGFTASESIQTIGDVSDLATGTLSSMATTVDLVTTALRVFKIDASESQVVVDVFANAVNRSKLTIDKLRTSFNYVGPIARDLGISLQETAASMMTLANSGLRASTIGTGLRRVFAELADPSEKLKVAIQNAGLSLEDLDPRSKNFREVIKNLGLVISDTSIAFDLFGKRGAAAALALSDSEGQFNQMLATVSRSGTAAEQAGIQVEGLGVSFKNLQDKLGLLAIAIGNAGITDALKLLIDAGRGLVDIFITIIDNSFVQFIAKGALVVGTITAIRVSLQKLAAISVANKLLALADASKAASTSLAVTTTRTTALRGAFAALGGPLGVVALALAGVASYLVSTIDDSEKAATAAAKLASEYGNLGKQFEDYQKKIADSDGDSKKLKETNLALRDSLLEVAFGSTEMAEEAAVAAASISALDGSLLKGTVALENYYKKLQELELNQLKESANEAEKNILEQQTGYLNTTLNRMKDNLTLIGKLVTGNFKSWNEYGKRSEEALDFADLLNEGKASFKDFDEYIKNLRGIKELTAQEKDLKSMFTLLESRSAALLKNLVDTGKIDLADSVDSIEDYLKSINVTGLEFEYLISKVKEFKGLSEGDYTNLIEKWEVDAKAAKESTAELYEQVKDSGRILTEVERERLEASNRSRIAQDKEKQVIIDKLNAIKAVRDADLKEATDSDQKAQIRAAYYKKLAILEKAAATLHAKYAEQGTVKDIQAFERLVSERKRQIDDLVIEYEKGSDKYAKKQYEINKTFTDGINKLFQVSVDPKELIAQTKVEVAEINSVFSLHYQELAALRAKRQISEVDYLRQKSTLEQQEADKIEKLWTATYKTIAENSTPDSPNAKKARIAQLKAIVAAGNKRIKAEQEIADKIEDVREEDKKHIEKTTNIHEEDAEKRKDIEDDYTDSVRDANRDLHEKLRDFQEKRVDLSRKYAEKRKDIEDDYKASVIKSNNDIDDSIDKVRQRGMSEKQKEVDNQKIASRELEELETRLKKARKSGNEEEIKSILDRTDKIKSLYENMANTGKAVKGLEDLKKFKEDVIKAGRVASLQALNKEISIERNKQSREFTHQLNIHKRKLADLKVERTEDLTKQLDVFNDAIKKEDARHTRKMTNIGAEATAALDAAKTIAKAQNAVASGNTVSTGTADSSTDSSNDTTSNIKESGDEIIKILSQAQKHAEHLAATMEADNGVAGSFDTVSKTGKRAFEELVIATTADGKKIVTTANTIARGFSAFGEIVSAGPLVSARELSDELDGIGEKEVEAKVSIDTQPTIEKAKDNLEGLTGTTVDINLELDKKAHEELAAKVEARKKEIEATKPAKIPAELETEGVDDKVKQVKTDIQSIDEVKPKLNVEIPQSEVNNIVAVLDKLDESMVDVKVDISGMEEITKVSELTTKLKELDKEDVKPEVEAKVEGDDKVNALEQAIKDIFSKTVNIIANVVGIEKLKALRSLIESIKSKTVTVTTIRKTIEAKAAGGAVGHEHYADGGSVFRRLASQYIGTGSGTKDDVPAMLMKGEFVMKKSAVQKYGLDLLYAINSGLLDLGKFMPKAYAAGGEVTTKAKDSVNSTILGLQRAINPSTPFSADGVTYNVNAPSFHQYISDTANKQKSSTGKKRATSLLSKFSDIVPRMMTGGSTSLLSDFAQEKALVSRLYSEDIRFAKDSGDDEVAFLLEMEKLQLEELANSLLITLQQIRYEYEQDMLEASKELAEQRESFAQDKTEAKSDYEESLSELNRERSDMERTYIQEKRELDQEILKAERIYEQLSSTHRILDVPGAKPLRGGSAEARQSKEIELASLRAELTALENGFKFATDSMDSEAVSEEKQYKREVRVANKGEKRAERQYGQYEDIRTNKAKVDEESETSKSDIGESKIKAETSFNVNKVQNQTRHDVTKLELDLQLELLKLRQTYEDLLSEEELSSNTTTVGQAQQLGVKYWLNKGGHVGYPKGKKRKKDDILAMLTAGEFVVNEDAVLHYGTEFMEALNNREVDPEYSDFPSFLSAPKSIRTPNTINGVTYHVNAPSFHDKLASNSTNLVTDQGKASAGRMVNLFSAAVPHLAEGGSIGTATQQLQFELDNTTDEYSERINYARETGNSELAYILENEKYELAVIAEELRYTLEELANERDWAITEAKLEYEEALEEARQELKDTLFELQMDRIDAKSDMIDALASLDMDISGVNSDWESARAGAATGDSSGLINAAEITKLKGDIKSWADRHYSYFDSNIGRVDWPYVSNIDQTLSQLKNITRSKQFRKGDTYTTWSDYTANSRLSALNDFAVKYAGLKTDASNQSAQEVSYTPYQSRINAYKKMKQNEKEKYSRLMGVYEEEELNARKKKNKEVKHATNERDYEVSKANREHDYGVTKANNESTRESNKASADALYNYTQREQETLNEIRLLEIELAKALFELRKEYSTASGDVSVKHFLNKGGPVWGNGAARGVDSVKAMLTPGEYVIKEDAVNKFGTGFFDMLNNMQLPKFFNLGGLVSDDAVNNVQNVTEKYLGRVDLGMNDKVFPVNMNQTMARDFVKELKRMGLSIA